MAVYLRMCKNDQFCEGSWILIVALHGNSFMFQGISSSRNDIKLRRGSYLRQSQEARTKTAGAICLDSQSMVDIVFVQVLPVLPLLWHT